MFFRFGIRPMLPAFCPFATFVRLLAISSLSLPLLPACHRCLCPPGTMLTIKLNLFSYFFSLRFANFAVGPRSTVHRPRLPLKVKVLSSAADVADNYVPPCMDFGTSGQRTKGQRTSLFKRTQRHALKKKTKIIKQERKQSKKLD